jgi:hypothetical protein
MTIDPHDLRPVAALFVSGRSIYRHLPGVDPYHRARPAALFKHDRPVVAHPPCRTWSRSLSHQARPVDVDQEQELARWAVRTVIICGGVLEQPAHSKLWDAMRLPMPYQPAPALLYTIALDQSWFGFGAPKKTWLLISRVPRCQIPPIPFILRHEKTGDITTMSTQERSRTMPLFADWLVAVARRSWWSLPVRLHPDTKTPGRKEIA